MPYMLVRTGNYPQTNLPVFTVFDAEEYNDPTVSNPYKLGEVWAIGTKGVTGEYVPTGVRWQLINSWKESPVYAIGAYAQAARAMIAESDKQAQTV